MDLDFNDAKRVFEALDPKEKASELKDIEFSIKVKRQDLSNKKHLLETQRRLKEKVRSNLRRDMQRLKVKKATKKMNVLTGEVTPIK